MPTPPPNRRFFPPPHGHELRNKGTHTRSVLTADGEIELSRRYFWCKGRGGVYPVDAALGIEHCSVSPGATEILCRMGLVQDFRQAAEDARRIGGIPIGCERLRQIVETQAKAVTEARDRGCVSAGWTAEEARTASRGPTRIYTGVDGVMVRTVTQVEKDKRRKNHAIRRRRRGRGGVGNVKPLPAPRPGSDEAFKEMKIGVFYDQDKEHRHAFVTAENHRSFGPLLREHARQVGFDRADQTISLTDGAKWIASQICLCLLTIKAMLLDFYHLAQHVHEAAQCCLGDTPEAKDWAGQRLREIKEQGLAPVLGAIDALAKKVRADAKRASLRRLRQYLVRCQRLEMLDYPAALAQGWDIGSGPTEAMCKTLTLRLKRPGMKWDADHAAPMMNLIALYESGQADAYWKSRRAA